MVASSGQVARDVAGRCEKHSLPRSAMLDLQLLMEELLHLHKPLLRDFDVDVSIAYSEKSGRLELVVETEDTGRDPSKHPRPMTISPPRSCE